MREGLLSVGDDVRITVGQIEDIPRCLDIAKELGEYFTSSALLAMARDLAGGRFLVAKDSTGCLGFMGLRDKNPGVSEIPWMAVQEDRWRQGIGSAMMEALCSDSKRRGIALLVAKTLAPTVDYAPYQATRRFYEKMRFYLVDVIDPYPGWDPGNPCAIYVKPLCCK